MIVLVAVLLLAALVAWWGARRARDAAEYFVAGRRAGAWLVGIAGTAAALSPFTFVGGPGLFWAIGAGSLWIIISAPLTGALQCWAVGEPVVEFVARTKAVTIPELLQRKLGGRAVRVAAALVIVVGGVASLAVDARAAFVLGEIFLGVPGLWCAVALMLATTLYTSLGGMRAGLLADAVQGGLMALVAVAIAAAALAAAGGPAGAVAALETARPQVLGSFGAAAPAKAFGFYALFCVGVCAQPRYVQKFFFLRSSDQLRRLPGVLTLALVLTLTVWIGVGIGGSALAAQGKIALGGPDDLAPRTMEFLGPWAVLLAGVGVLAALMSSASSLLNLAAAALTRDLPESCGGAPRGVGAARAATVVVAAAGTLLGAQSARTVALLGILGWGFFTAALLPAMTIGLLWRRASGRGVAASMIVGGAVDLSLELLRTQLPPGLEPGLAGALAAALVLVLFPRTSAASGVV